MTWGVTLRAATEVPDRSPLRSSVLYSAFDAQARTGFTGHITGPARGYERLIHWGAPLNVKQTESRWLRKGALPELERLSRAGVLPHQKRKTQPGLTTGRASR